MALEEPGIVWYESKELIDHTELNNPKYQGMFELNLSEEGEPIISRKIFKPIHGEQRAQDSDFLVYKGDHTDGLGYKDQAASAIIRLQMKFQSLNARLASVEAAIKQLDDASLNENHHSVDRWDTHAKPYKWDLLIKGLLWLFWPIFVKVAFNNLGYLITTIMKQR